MKVSVIIPALNEADGIAMAVEKAWAAGASEVIVIDGGSRDETTQIVQRYNCCLIESPPGRAIQQNLGAEQARGEILLFQHADNWLEQGAIQQIIEACSHPRVLGGAFQQRIEANGYLFRLLEWGNAQRVRQFGLAYGDQGIFLRRGIFEDLGRFPEVPLMEDLLLMKNFRCRAWPVLLPGPLHVSPRRWRRFGVVRQTLRNWGLLTAYRLGVSPQRLARYYPRHDEL